jgi:uncharacterized protein with HEPN domain
MRPEILKLVYDVEQASSLILDFTEGKSLDDYNEDVLLRSGVERQFEIIGEALSNALKIDSSFADSITGAKKIISFRNIIIHGYAAIDNARVWEIIKINLPVLHKEAEEILRKHGSG